MTVKEAAVLKQVSESSIRLALVTRRIKGRKVGRDWQVDTRSVAGWTPERRGPKPGRLVTR